MSAAATVLDLIGEEEQERMTPPRHDDTSYEDMSARELSLRAIEATVQLAHEVGHLAAVVASLETRLSTDFVDNKTDKLRRQSEELERIHNREKWFKRVITAVVTAVAIAEVLRWMGLAKAMGGG
jgi:hypothetical protein